MDTRRWSVVRWAVPPREFNTQKLALVMVGLPARGKTYVARKIARYLAWLGHLTKVFNVGNYRRERLDGNQMHEFFDPRNAQTRAIRMDLATAALEDMIRWLSEGGDVGIYDATNSTRERRDWVFERCQRDNIQVVFIESICDATVVEANIREAKLSSPDYSAMDPDAAVRDFRARIAHYESTYEPVDDTTRSFVKLIDVGRQVVVNRMEGYLSARLIFFLMNIHNGRRRIWLTRHGECQFNVEGRIGGDSSLTENGLAYAQSLRRFVSTERGESRVSVWTSTLKRTLETAAALDERAVPWRSLDELYAGQFDGLTFDEFEARWPGEADARKRDKFRYRYPRGESYADVIQRLEPVIVELERQRDPVLVIAHQAVLRALYGYLRGKPQEDCPRLPIPLHTVIALTPTAYGYDEHRFGLEPALEGAPLSMV